jgi:hypothetical protein
MDNPDAKYAQAAYKLANYRRKHPILKRPGITTYIRSTLPNVTLPQTWDWRKEAPGKINPSYDQLGSGACYLFGTLHAFSDRYAIFTNQNYVHMSEVEFAAVARAFNSDGDPSTDDPSTRSGKVDCINCDPFNNGSAYTIIYAVGVFGTVAVGNRTNNPDYYFPAFCDVHHNCKCPGDDWHGHDNYCDDDSIPNYQSDLSKALPSNIEATYGRDVIFPIPSIKPLMTVMSVSTTDFLTFEDIATIIYTGGPIGIDFNFNGDFMRVGPKKNGEYENWRETGGIYLCLDWDDNNTNPFGYKDRGKGGSGGHSVSVIGFGTQRVSFQFYGENVTQDIQYLLCRNSWGADSPRAYFKAGWIQMIQGQQHVMNGVWGSMGYVNFSKKYECVTKGQPCIQTDQGIYDNPDECAKNCQKYECVTKGQPCIQTDQGIYDDPDECAKNCQEKRFKCIDRKFCREDPSGSFTNPLICKQKCILPKPSRSGKNKLSMVLLSIFVVLGGIAVIVLGYIIYKRSRK